MEVAGSGLWVLATYIQTLANRQTYEIEFCSVHSPTYCHLKMTVLKGNGQHIIDRKMHLKQLSLHNSHVEMVEKVASVFTVWQTTKGTSPMKAKRLVSHIVGNCTPPHPTPSVAQPIVNIDFSLRAGCWHRGGVGGQFPRILQWS